MNSTIRHLGPITIDPTIYDRITNTTMPNPAYHVVEELSSVLVSPNIKNIAVAGNYGAGKSSIVQTAINKVEDEESRLAIWWKFWNRKRKRKFINISLALLNTLKPIEDEEETKNDQKQGHNVQIIKKSSKYTSNTVLSDEQIEYSILQQMLYYDIPSKTPKSRFYRLRSVKWWEPILGGLAIIIAILCFCILFNPEILRVDSFVEKFKVTASVKFWIDIASATILSLYFIGVVWWIIRRTRFHVSTIKIKDTELAIDNLSVFNHYLDEIIYFFAATKYNVVIFEDLDRFTDSTKIFGKLRELNRILNNSQYLKDILQREITFVYSVKDDLFDATNRVKFFDYIVPVIPVINSSNAYEKLTEFLDAEDLNVLDGKDFLNLCEYFEDLRLLINIVNEFNLYKKIINLDSFKLLKRKLFGIIVYKNYCPDDFAKMYNGHGVVAGILDNKKKIIDEIDAIQHRRLQEEKNKLQVLETKSSEWESKIREEYVEESKNQANSYVQRSYTNYILAQNSTIYSFDEVAKDPKAFTYLENDEFNLYDGSSQWRINSFADWQKVVNSKKTYRERLEANPYLKELNNQREKIENSITIELKASDSLGKIANVDLSVIDAYLSKENGNSKRYIASDKIPLIRFLLLHDFIDEHYRDYITYFYPNSLGMEDKRFVINVTSLDSESLSYDFPLIKPQSVVNHFEVGDFDTNRRLLNIDLVSFLALNGDDQKTNRKAIVRNLVRVKDIDFLIALYESNKEGAHTFVHEVLNSWDISLMPDNLKNNDTRRHVLREIYLKYSNISSKELLNHNFGRWINNHFKFVADRVSVIGEKRLLEFFDAYNIVFERINLSEVSKNVADNIISKNRYVINAHNLEDIAYYLNILENYRQASLTTLIGCGVHALSSAVSSNLPDFIKCFPSTSTEETEITKVQIVNDSRISVNMKKSYLSRQRLRIYNAEDITDSTLDFVFNESLITPTWENLYYLCFVKNKPAPRAFLKKNKLEGFLSLKNEQQKIIITNWVFSNILTLDIYGFVVDSMAVAFRSFPANIDEARAHILINKKLVQFNIENYTVVRENYPLLASDYIENNMDAYLDNVADYAVSANEMLRVLSVLKYKTRQAEYLSKQPQFEGDVTPKLASIISALIKGRELKLSTLTEVFLIATIKNTKEEDLRMYIGRRSLFELPFDNKRCRTILEAMGGQYLRILSPGDTCHITNNYNNIRIAKYLADNNFIDTYEIVDNKKIKINKI